MGHIKTIAAAATMALLASSVEAAVIDFDDLSPPPATSVEFTGKTEDGFSITPSGFRWEIFDQYIGGVDRASLTIQQTTGERFTFSSVDLFGADPSPIGGLYDYTFVGSFGGTELFRQSDVTTSRWETFSNTFNLVEIDLLRIDLSSDSFGTTFLDNIVVNPVTTTAPVPLPAGGWLVLSALGALFCVRRRKVRV